MYNLLPQEIIIKDCFKKALRDTYNSYTINLGIFINHLREHLHQSFILEYCQVKVLSQIRYWLNIETVKKYLPIINFRGLKMDNNKIQELLNIAKKEIYEERDLYSLENVYNTLNTYTENIKSINKESETVTQTLLNIAEGV